jgi:hypothetical protein
VSAGDTEGVVHHQNLTVGDVACTDTNHRNGRRVGDAFASSTGTHSSTSSWAPAASSARASSAASGRRRRGPALYIHQRC